jgi:CheY-like chemotaxis protein
MTDPGPLRAKVFAIVGLPAAATMAIAEALEREGASWRASSDAASAATGDVDAIVCALESAKALATARFPILALGPIEELARADEAPPAGDFMVYPPLEIDELLLRLRRLVSGGGSRAPRRRRRERPLILTADDDPTTTTIIRAVVMRNGMDCEVAGDGREALERAAAIAPDAMILDVNMPFLDGFEVLAAMRNDPALREIPVIILTSVQQESDVVRGFTLGADDYVVKPFNPMELLARLRRVVEKE